MMEMKQENASRTAPRNDLSSASFGSARPATPIELVARLTGRAAVASALFAGVGSATSAALPGLTAAAVLIPTVRMAMRAYAAFKESLMPSGSITGTSREQGSISRNEMPMRTISQELAEAAHSGFRAGMESLRQDAISITHSIFQGLRNVVAGTIVKSRVEMGINQCEILRRDLSDWLRANPNRLSAHNVTRVEEHLQDAWNTQCRATQSGLGSGEQLALVKKIKDSLNQALGVLNSQLAA
jgi:hypothetical protein